MSSTSPIVHPHEAPSTPIAPSAGLDFTQHVFRADVARNGERTIIRE